MRTKNCLFLLTLLCAWFCVPFTVQGQVKIGDSSEPAKGAVLDLNAGVSGYVGGLLLPNVAIDNVAQIPSSFNDAGKISTNELKQALAGMLVYNTKDNVVGGNGKGKGVYVWTGNVWVYIGGGE